MQDAVNQIIDDHDRPVLKSFPSSSDMNLYLLSPINNTMECTLAGVDFGDSLKVSYCIIY